MIQPKIKKQKNTFNETYAVVKEFRQLMLLESQANVKLLYSLLVLTKVKTSEIFIPSQICIKYVF